MAGTDAVAFIGLGNMGRPMALNLAARGVRGVRACVGGVWIGNVGGARGADEWNFWRDGGGAAAGDDVPIALGDAG